jgi:hypothetical protein
VLLLPEPVVVVLLEVEPALPPAPALPVVLPEPDGTQPAGMLPSARLPLPVVVSVLEPDELEPLVPIEPELDPEPVVPIEPELEPPVDPLAPVPEEPELPELPPVCASAVPAASIAANVKATIFVIFALPYGVNVQSTITGEACSTCSAFYRLLTRARGDLASAHGIFPISAQASAGLIAACHAVDP